MSVQTTTNTLAQRWAQLKEEQPTLRIRDAAKALVVSEAELLATQIGQNVTRISDNWQSVLAQLPKLGEVMVLTRNEAVVIEKDGICPEPQFFEMGSSVIGQMVSKEIDLRLFLNAWHLGFAVQNPSAPRLQNSLQFFDAFGDAIVKVFLERSADVSVYAALVEAYRHPNQQSEGISVQPASQKPHYAANAAPAVNEFLEGWAQLKDTHEFFGLTRKHSLPRHQAVQLANGRFSWQVQPQQALRQVLQSARASKTSIMAFVGNPGCIEIHTGPIGNVKEVDTWHNVLDAHFNLHVQEPHLQYAYLVEKPTSDGLVTSIEFFNAEQELVLQFFGERKPGKPELPEWRELALQIRESNAVA